MAQVYDEHPKEYSRLGVLIIHKVIESIDKNQVAKKKEMTQCSISYYKKLW
jgi:hypothetical protein